LEEDIICSSSVEEEAEERGGEKKGEEMWRTITEKILKFEENSKMCTIS
jgi:hypothetical protein